MNRTLFVENVKLSGVASAIALARACGVNTVVIELWVITCKECHNV